LKWSQCGLEVGGVGLEVIESASDAGLELGWLLAGWARGRDLVEGTHGCGCREKESLGEFAKLMFEIQKGRLVCLASLANGDEGLLIHVTGYLLPVSDFGELEVSFREEKT
jgi:hypothetical protein